MFTEYTRPVKLRDTNKIKLEYIHINDNTLKDGIFYKESNLLIKTENVMCCVYGRYIRLYIKIGDPLLKVLQTIELLVDANITIKSLIYGYYEATVDTFKCCFFDCNMENTAPPPLNTNCYMRFIIGFSGIIELTPNTKDSVMKENTALRKRKISIYAYQCQLKDELNDWLKCRFDRNI